MLDICLCSSMGCDKRRTCLRAIEYDSPKTKFGYSVSHLAEYCSKDNDYEYYIEGDENARSI